MKTPLAPLERFRLLCPKTKDHPMTAPLRILLLASCEHDRRDLAGWIAARPENTDILACRDISEVLDSGLRTGEPPRLVILSAGFTQAWSLEEFAELWNELPLARWIVVQNGWSDSALRHYPWLPPGVCVPRVRDSLSVWVCLLSDVNLMP